MDTLPMILPIGNAQNARTQRAQTGMLGQLALPGELANSRMIGPTSRSIEPAIGPRADSASLESGLAIPGGGEESSSGTCMRVGSPRQRAEQNAQRHEGIIV